MTLLSWLVILGVYALVTGAFVLGLARAAGDADDRVPGLREWEAQQQQRAVRRPRRR